MTTAAQDCEQTRINGLLAALRDAEAEQTLATAARRFDPAALGQIAARQVHSAFLSG